MGDSLAEAPLLIADNDSAYESAEHCSSTASLSETIHETIYENGRRYHTYGGLDRILFPTDERGQDALNRVHVLVTLLQDQKLHLAPLGKSPKRVLDVGTGTGVWAIDMAYEYPFAQITGVDLSPIQPTMVPGNCRFEIDDAEKKWAYKENSFDFIYIRNVSQSVTDWTTLLSEAYRCLAPGGYIELSELGTSALSDDNTLGVDPGLSNWINKIRELAEKMGRPEPTTKSMKALLQNAGFWNIHPTVFKWPYAPWPKALRWKTIGQITLRDLEKGQVFHTQAMAMLTRIGGMSTEEAQKLCDEALRAVKNPKLHTYNIHSVVWAQKSYGSSE